MAIPTLGGFIWHHQWNAPGEGPYSIVAKLIHANAIPASRLKEVIYWKGTEGANLLMPKPKQSLDERSASLARLIHDSSLFSSLRYQHLKLANDQALRYCCKCMSTGFQAAIAQIEGFDECPIHKEPHLSICKRCGASTPPYYLGNKDRLPKFSCRQCGFPFGGSVLIERRLDAWRPPDELHRLNWIHTWLRKINDHQNIDGTLTSTWNTTPFLEEGEDHYWRRAVFALLCRLFPDPIICPPKSVRNLSVFGPFPFNLSFPRPSKYESVNPSKLLRHLPWGCKFEDHRLKLRMPSFGVLVPDDPSVPPSIHAKIIFHAQFEHLNYDLDDWGFGTWLSSRAIVEVLDDRYHRVAFKGFEDKTFVKAILEATLMAAERIANEWNRLLLGMSRSDTTRINDEWLTACTRWASRLGCWREQGYFPIGLILARDNTSQERAIYLAVA